MNEIVISRIPVSRETTPTLCAHQTYVPRETPTILKHNKTTHATTKATRSQPTKPQQPPQINHHVSRETPPPQQRQEKEFSKTITSNLTTPPCVSRETHWHPWDVVKQKQRFTWNKWVVVKTSCFTWNIEKPSNTRKHNHRRKRFPSQALPMFHVKHSK